MAEQICKNCQYFAPDDLQPEQELGECRRHPPQIIWNITKSKKEMKNIDDSVWPAVDPDDWCGEYQFHGNE